MMATTVPVVRFRKMLSRGITTMQHSRIGCVISEAVAVVATTSKNAVREHVQSDNDGDDAIHHSLRRLSRQVFNDPYLGILCRGAS